MKDKWLLVFLFFVFLAYVYATPNIALFYDSPEYLDQVGNQTYLEAMATGHQPIRPGFMLLFWPGFKLLNLFFPAGYAANLFSAIIGIASVYLFFKLSKSYLSTLLFILLPITWIANTNLLVETLSLFQFLMASLILVSYAKKQSKNKLIFFGLVVIWMLTTHIQTIVWLPALFGILYFYKKKSGDLFFVVVKLVKTVLLSLVISILIYIFFFAIRGIDIVFHTKYLFFGKIEAVYQINSFISYARFLRNFFVSSIRAFGTLTFFAFALFAIRDLAKIKNNFYNIFLIFPLISLIIIGSSWYGDLMIRRIIFLAPFIAIYFTKLFKNKVILLILYLLPITIFNAVLYANQNELFINKMQKMYVNLPEKATLIYSQYYYPFVNFKGEIYVIDNLDTQSIEKMIDDGKLVLLDSQAITSPYKIISGNNYHITSLNKNGDGQAKSILSSFDYEIYYIEDPCQNIYAIKLDKHIGKKSSNAGEKIIIDSNKILLRERIDYGDLLTWIWHIALGKKDPAYWTYRNASGKYHLPAECNN